MKYTEILHVYSSFGGVHDYSVIIDRLLKETGVSVMPLEVPMSTSYHSKAYIQARKKINEFLDQGKLVHYEIGLNDIAIYSLLKDSERTKEITHNFVVTIHDPGEVVYSTTLVTQKSLYSKLIHKIIGDYLRRREIKHVLKGASSLISLARDIKVFDLPTTYIPQPTYKLRPPVVNRKPKKTPTVGFMGFWGPSKGILTLANVITGRWVKGDNSTRFLIAGSTIDPSDNFATNIKDMLANASGIVRFTGFLPDAEIGVFLNEIDALVVPYLDTSKGASSGVVQRAMEYGLPIIASKTDYLCSQTYGKAIYVLPGDVVSLENGIKKFQKNQQREIERALDLQKKVYVDQGWREVASQILNSYNRH